MIETKLPMTYRISFHFGVASAILVPAPFLIAHINSRIRVLSLELIETLTRNCLIASGLCAVVDILLIAYLAMTGAKTPKTPLLLCIPIGLTIVGGLLLLFLFSGLSLPGHG